MKLLSTVLFASFIFGAQSATAAMKVAFDWGPTKNCFDSKSPPFRLSGAPKGTAKLLFRMQDLDSPDYNHGGGSVVFTGQSQIPYGSFSYTGPCPPSGETHRYKFTVKALDKGGNLLDTAFASKNFKR